MAKLKKNEQNPTEILLDNGKQIYMVQKVGYSTLSYFCNINHIPDIITNRLNTTEGFIIYQYYNKKFKKCSKELMNQFFVSNRIDFQIK